MLQEAVMSLVIKNLRKHLNGHFQLEENGKQDALEILESGCSKTGIPLRQLLNYSLKKQIKFFKRN